MNGQEAPSDIIVVGAGIAGLSAVLSAQEGRAKVLVLSAYYPDATDDHSKFVGGPEEFVKWAMRQHTEAHLGYTPNLFNHTGELSGDVAHTGTYTDPSYQRPRELSPGRLESWKRLSALTTGTADDGASE